MIPQIADNDDGTDLAAWLAQIPSFASDWPAGVLSVAPPVADKSAPGDYFKR